MTVLVTKQSEESPQQFYANPSGDTALKIQRKSAESAGNPLREVLRLSGGPGQPFRKNNHLNFVFHLLFHNFPIIFFGLNYDQT